jgi:hypothetical protein
VIAIEQKTIRDKKDQLPAGEQRGILDERLKPASDRVVIEDPSRICDARWSTISAAVWRASPGFL